jgi:hypothetical protein
MLPYYFEFTTLLIMLICINLLINKGDILPVVMKIIGDLKKTPLLAEF